MLKKIMFVTITALSSNIYAQSTLMPLSINETQPTDCVSKAMSKEGKILASFTETARIKVDGKVLTLKMLKSKSKTETVYQANNLTVTTKVVGKSIEKESEDGALETKTPGQLEFNGTTIPVTFESICM